MSKYTIDFNYRQALGQADQLDLVASSLEKKAVSILDEIIENVSYNWRGDNVEIYKSKGNILKEKLNTTASSLRNSAKQIRYVAKRIHDAERKNLEIAERREY